MEKSMMRNWILPKRLVVIRGHIYFCVPKNCSLLRAVHRALCFPRAISRPLCGEGNALLNFIEEEMSFQGDSLPRLISLPRRFCYLLPSLCRPLLISMDPCRNEERSVGVRGQLNFKSDQKSCLFYIVMEQAISWKQ